MVDTLDMTGRKDPVEQAITGGRSLWDDAKRRLFNNKAAVVSMWVLGLIEPAAAKASAMRIGGVLGICLVAALAMVAVFSIGGRQSG